MKFSIILCAFFAITTVVGNATSINLGPAADYGVLGINGAAINTGATVHLSSGPLIVNGNVGSGDNGQFQADGGGHINGRLDFAPSATINPGNDTFSGGMHQISFNPIEQAVQNEANFVQGLTPTQSFTSITNATTLNSAGGQNVISIAQDIHLSDGNLTLNGSASDVFIFQIKGTMELSGNSDIVLTGGLTPNNVLFDFIGAGSQFQTSGQAKTAGIFLAEDRAININGGIHDSEFISGVSLSFQSNPTVNQPGTVPDRGSTLLLMSLGLMIIGMVRPGLAQRRSKQST